MEEGQIIIAECSAFYMPLQQSGPPKSGPITTNCSIAIYVDVETQSCKIVLYTDQQLVFSLTLEASLLSQQVIIATERTPEVQLVKRKGVQAFGLTVQDVSEIGRESSASSSDWSSDDERKRAKGRPRRSSMLQRGAFIVFSSFVELKELLLRIHVGVYMADGGRNALGMSLPQWQPLSESNISIVEGCEVQLLVDGLVVTNGVESQHIAFLPEIQKRDETGKKISTVGYSFMVDYHQGADHSDPFLKLLHQSRADASFLLVSDSVDGINLWPWLPELLQGVVKELSDESSVPNPSIKAVLKSIPNKNAINIVSMCLTIQHVEGADPAADLKKRLRKQGAGQVMVNAAEVSEKIRSRTSSVMEPAADKETVQDPSKAGGEEETAALLPEKKEKKKKHKHKQEASDVADATGEGEGSKNVSFAKSLERRSTEDVASPLEGEEEVGEMGYEALKKFEQKLERKKQRLLKFEADLIEQNAEVAGKQNNLLVRERELESHSIHVRNAQTQLELEKRKQNESSPLAARRSARQSSANEGSPLIVNRTSTPTQGLTAPAAPSNITNDSFSFRVQFDLYDPSTLPRGIFENYSLAAWFVQIGTRLYFVVPLCLILLTCIVLLLLSETGRNDGWALMVFYILSATCALLTHIRRDDLFEQLHRIVQVSATSSTAAWSSTSSVGPFIYRYRATFLLLPLCGFCLSLMPLIIFVSMPSIFPFGAPATFRVACLLGVPMAVLLLNIMMCLFGLTTCMCYERIRQTVVSEDCAALQHRNLIRAAMATYQYLKRVVSHTSALWQPSSLSLLVTVLFGIVYSIYSAVLNHPYESRITVIALSTFIPSCCALTFYLSCIVDWQDATKDLIGTIALHLDRWTRGDFSSPPSQGGDRSGVTVPLAPGDSNDPTTDPTAAVVTITDFLQFQDFLRYSMMGSQHARWGFLHYSQQGNALFSVNFRPSTMSQTRLVVLSTWWLVGAYFLLVLSIVSIPIVIKYNL